MHRTVEERWFYVVNIGTGIVTVLFTMRDARIRIFGAGYWRKMHNEDDPFNFGEVLEGELVVVKDFLPPPEALVLKEPATEKITIALSKETVAFFREKAQELGAPYQRMIRNLLDAYIAQHREHLWMVRLCVTD